MSGTDYTTTPNLGLFKPIANADINQWGSHLNLNADTLDAKLSTSTGGLFLPLSGGRMTGPISWLASGTSGSYDAQITTTGGGTQPGHGEIKQTAALSHFYTFDASEQFRVGSVPGAAEVWEARGGITGAGATLVASGAASNVDGVIVAQGSGNIHFRNSNSPLLEVFASGSGPTVNYLQVVGGKVGDFVSLSFVGGDTNVNGYIGTKGTGALFLATGNGTAAIFEDAGAASTSPILVYPGTASQPARLTSGSGSVSVGGAVIATTSTAGFLYIPRMDGAPTGVPALVTGGVPIVFDDANNRLCIFSSGVWKSVAVA